MYGMYVMIKCKFNFQLRSNVVNREDERTQGLEGEV